jgi:ribonuclease R
VGASFQQRGEQTIWRVHDVPDEDKLEDFAHLAERYGIAVDVAAARTPRGLQKVLERFKGNSAEKALSFQLLRSLKQATYETVNVGHFGLASAAYIHFTSPIRRYPDLVAHRLLKRRLAALHKPAGGFRPHEGDEAERLVGLQKAGADASFAERKAMEVEREVMNLYRAFFLRDRVGDVFEGTISGVAGFGVFVTIDEPFVEGLVRVDYLVPDDYYVFDDVSLRMVGRRTGRAFALGDRVRVELVSASVARRKIDFKLSGSQPDAAHHPPIEGKRRRRGEKGAAKHRGGERGEDRKRKRERPKPARKAGGRKRTRR